MPRWEPDGVGRLQAAAIELFAERGFERTTVAEITQRAGLTRRTFFNHFADKREVLFGPVAEVYRETVTREIAACPDALPPLEAIVRGLQAAGDSMFEARRAALTSRREIIDAIAGALRTRGVDSDTALLSARVGVLVQQTAMQRWTQSVGNRPLRDFFSDALLSLRTIAARPTTGQA
jgi:AcrR family transcriptional regulator